MKLDSRLLQRLLLAFTTGLFLSCAAKVSATQPGDSPFTFAVEE